MGMRLGGTRRETRGWHQVFYNEPPGLTVVDSEERPQQGPVSGSAVGWEEGPFREPEAWVKTALQELTSHLKSIKSEASVGWRPPTHSRNVTEPHDSWKFSC